MVILQNIVLLIVIITITEIVLKIGSCFFLKQNKGVAKQINCPYYRPPIRDVFDNYYACKWKVDGSGVKLPTNSKIEIVIVNNSKNSEECDILDFREQNSGINVYNAKLKVTQEKFKVWMYDNNLQENTLEKNEKVVELEMHLIDLAIPIILYLLKIYW